MNRIEICSLGGKIRAKTQRDQALNEYYQNPNICIECNEIIKVRDEEKVAWTRRKRFCSKSCAALYNNRKRWGVNKSICKNQKLKYDVFNNRIQINSITTKTKYDVFNNGKNQQSARSSIRRHAFKMYVSSGLPLLCSKCGYDNHVNICHIRPVSSFSDDTLISEINDITNLIALCPNHHQEFDNISEKV